MSRTHAEIDLRSLTLHRRVAERLRDEPSLLQIARDNLERWRRRHDSDDPAAPAVAEWQTILDTVTLEQLCDLLVREHEDAKRLRQSSPFAGVLSPAEVWRIKRSFRNEKTPA